MCGPDRTMGTDARVATYGRDTVVPMLETLLSGHTALGVFESAGDAAETFIFLLVGDMQARRALGQLPEPDDAFRKERARKATERFLLLAGAQVLGAVGKPNG